MGNISKTKPDGSIKHRLIQDLKRNHVNKAVVLPERQVLPRPIDHGVDIARLASELKPGAVLASMVLDFKNAFMQVPLVAEEMPYNCASVAQGINRTRAAFDDQEPDSGSFVVWQVQSC